MKRLIPVLLLLTLAFSMCACDMSMLQNILENLPLETTENQQTTPDKTTPEETTTETPPSDGKITITFYHTMGTNLSEVLNIYIEEFQTLYPNITVLHEFRGDYDSLRDTIQKELTFDQHPNIAYCYPDHVALYNTSKAVVTLDQFISNQQELTLADGTKEIVGLTQAQIDDFIDAFYEEGSPFGDGLMYTMPLSKTTEVLYYNVDFFNEHGLTPPTTWDELEALCARIKAIDPNCIPLGYDSESNWFINMCKQLGSPYTSSTGNHYLFDNETNREFVARFREWYQKGYVTTQDLNGSTYTSTLFTQTNSDSVKCYMCIASSKDANHHRSCFEVGITTVPQVDPDSPKVISQGPSLCIFKDSNPDEVLASWLFVKFLTTNVGFQAEFSMASGYVPVIKSVEDHPVYANFLNKANGGNNVAALSAKVCMEQAGAYFTTPAFVGSAMARDQVGVLLQQCLCDSNCATSKGIKKAFENAIKECEYWLSLLTPQSPYHPR